MVTNGYITREAFHDIYDHVDAANVDLKAFTENFYGRITLTHLQPVLEMLEWLKNETNVWFEITNLMIPTLNDDPGETRGSRNGFCENLGPDVPLHFTAFHPDFKLRDKPRTPPETLALPRAKITLEAGLHYVYEGNIHSDAAHTVCPDARAADPAFVACGAGKFYTRGKVSVVREGDSRAMGESGLRRGLCGDSRFWENCG